ncbi:MAG TPA: hypothetical protein VJ907_07705 [Halanaerobiales bacterium]|nr:hypothetical protein [Halanaerobiales bacterium]
MDLINFLWTIIIPGSDIIKKKFWKLKEKMFVFLHQKNSYLFFLIGLITGIIFMLANFVKDISIGITALIIGIIIFEIFKHYFGETPNIIVTDHEDKEETYAMIKKAIQDSIEEKTKEAD